MLWNEQTRKKEYKSQILNVEQKTFTPPVFSTAREENVWFLLKSVKLVMQYYEVAYYTFEEAESQIMSMKNWMKYCVML